MSAARQGQGGGAGVPAAGRDGRRLASKPWGRAGWRGGGEGGQPSCSLFNSFTSYSFSAMVTVRAEQSDPLTSSNKAEAPNGPRPACTRLGGVSAARAAQPHVAAPPVTIHPIPRVGSSAAQSVIVCTCCSVTLSARLSRARHKICARHERERLC